jgi:hypothetical protein
VHRKHRTSLPNHLSGNLTSLNVDCFFSDLTQWNNWCVNTRRKLNEVVFVESTNFRALPKRWTFQLYLYSFGFHNTLVIVTIQNFHRFTFVNCITRSYGFLSLFCWLAAQTQVTKYEMYIRVLCENTIFLIPTCTYLGSGSASSSGSRGTGISIILQRRYCNSIVCSHKIRVVLAHLDHQEQVSIKP